MTIKVLDDSLINKIAAGEVIERPANIIKELVENSLDANADAIKIEIENSGLKKIRVVDNGSGMSREDLLLSYKRHTTSKISNASDLQSIESLGFRGEALASMAEVSYIKIKTKEKDSDVGNMVEVEGGILLANEKIGCPDGTSVEIQDLFYNVPARKKFLKSPEVELAHIIDIVTRYALIRKDISFILSHNDKEILNSQKTDNQLNNIIFVYGTDIAKNLIEVDYKAADIKIQGFISKPNLTRANKNEQSLFVNNRYVRSQPINDAIYSAYKTFLFTNRHPIYILNLTIKPSTVDVNVHPNKLDIRLRNERDVCESFFVAVKKALGSHILIPTATPETETKRKATNIYELKKDVQSNLFQEEKIENDEDEQEDIEQEKVEQEFDYTINQITNKVEDRPIQPELVKTKEEKINKFKDFRVLGQVNKTFIVTENEEGLAIIDQHAAEERVNYEKFMEELKEKAIKKQTLLEPKLLELNPIQYQTAANNLEFLEKLGFTYEDFGGTTIRVTAIPEIFGKLKTTLLIDIINELAKVNKDIIDQEIEDRIIRMSCRASIKAGDELSFSQMKELIEELGRAENPYSCPHGRPTIIQLTQADLEKKFKRTGW